MHYPAPSLTDPPADSPIADGVLWVQGVALGTTATAITAIAIAAIGLLMLSGRLGLRRGIAVVAGCFILFGASAIATALTGFGSGLKEDDRPPPADTGHLRGPLQALKPPTSAYDPYAGASVPAAQ